MSDISIGIVASSREWRTVLQAHVRDHVAGVRVQILREPRLALELDLDVVIIDDTSSFLTKDKVVRLREKGTRVVGIYDALEQEGLGPAFLEKLGIDLSLPSTISPEEMINAVSQLQPKAHYANSFDQMVDNYSNGGIPSSATQSTVISVGGPAGVGSTEIAIALADALVARKEPTLLIDCDEVGPSVARRLGFHLHPNILSAIDVVANVSKPLPQVVGRPSDRAANAVYFDVIPGIANMEDWVQLRSTEINDLFNAIKKSYRYCVANVGPMLEDLSGYGMERFASSRTTCENSEIIVGVMSPTPTGYLRFLDWMASLRTLGKENAVAIVINNAPKSAFVRGEIESQLIRDIDSRYIASINFVPFDEHVDKANWEGQRVTKGIFISAIADLAKNIVPVYANSSRGSKKAQRAVTPATNYISGADSAPRQVTASWNDEDIVDPNVNPDLNRQISTPQPVAPPVAPQVQIPEPPVASAPVAQPYVEQPSVPQSLAPVWQPTPEPVQAPAPVAPAPPTQAPNFESPVIGSPSYVPSFKKAAPQDMTPADKIDEALNQPNDFLQDHDTEENAHTDDGQNKFWSP